MLVGIHVLIIIPDGVYGSSLVIGRRMSFPIKSHLAPISILVHQGEGIGIIEMNLCHQAMLRLVLEASDIVGILVCQVYLCLWSLHDEHTFSILAPCRTNGIQEHLLIFQESVGKLLAVGSQHFTFYLRTGATYSRFIQCRKEYTLVIFLELIGNINPQLAIHLLMF